MSLNLFKLASMGKNPLLLCSDLSPIPSSARALSSCRRCINFTSLTDEHKSSLCIVLLQYEARKQSAKKRSGQESYCAPLIAFNSPCSSFSDLSRGRNHTCPNQRYFAGSKTTYVVEELVMPGVCLLGTSPHLSLVYRLPASRRTPQSTLLRCSVSPKTKPQPSLPRLCSWLYGCLVWV